jgi:hypothetical protein
MNASHRNLLNFVVFQLAWFACVLGGARGYELAGTLVVAAAVALHVALATRAALAATLVVAVATVGLLWDSLLVTLGLMVYPSGSLAPGLAPLWIVAMWALFATTLNLSLGWLQGRPVLAALLGAVGGPLAYLAGQRLGAIELPEPALALLVQGLGWSLLMPLLAWLATRLNGFEPVVASPSPVAVQRAPALRSLPIGPVLLCALVGLSTPTAQASAAARTLAFDVFLDERRIGEQQFALYPTATGLRMETRARFEVKLLRITAFSYEHRNVEQWRGGCLASIESVTDSNGTPYRVSGRLQQDGLRLDGTNGGQPLPGCVGTFSYWDREQLVGRERLLNSQTGEYVAVSVQPLADARLRIGDREVTVERYALRGTGLDLTVSYASDSGEWLALDSRLDGGRMLRYRRALPSQLATTP